MAGEYEVGYRRPPKTTRFKPGQSGNPKGRPAKARNFKSDVKKTLETALLHDSTAARVGALFQLLVQDTTAQDFGLPSSAIRLRM